MQNTGDFTMMFRVNGAAVYARGGSMIPMDLLNGRLSAEAHRRLVQSAAEGNFNTMRIW
jgi:beta-mannosidase